MRTVFGDFDEFADAINGVAGRFVPTGRANRDWWVEVVGVERLAVQQVQIGGPSTFAGDGRDRSLTIGVPATEPRRIRIDGNALDERSFILVKENQPFTFSAGHPTLWAGITIPFDHPALPPDLLHALGGRSWNLGHATHTRSDLSYVSEMRRLINRVCLDDRTRVIWSHITGQALEDEILAIACRALEVSSKVVDRKHLGRPRHNRERIIARALELMHACEGKPLLLRDLCEATQVSERSLRYVFQEYFSVSPIRLLKLRQLHEVRAALLAADPVTSSVSEVTARFGVWDMSLFARNYRALYAERPSDTLRRPASAPKHDDVTNPSWMLFVLRRFVERLEREHARRTYTRIEHRRGPPFM